MAQPKKSANPMGRNHPLWRPYTAEEIRAVAKMWEKSTIDEMCTALNRSRQSIQYIAGQMRKAGASLSRKRSAPTQMDMIKAALNIK